MLHVRVSRNPSNAIDGIHISVTEESIPVFEQLIHRALNCWDSAPQEIKELGDMITHGHITQDHRYKPINSGGNTEWYSPVEQAKIKEYIAIYGMDAWLRRIRDNTTHMVLDGTAKD
jgi:hypothetical protein